MPSWKAMLSASPRTGDLWCHGTRYVRHARGWYAYRVRTVRAWGPQEQAALRLRYHGTREAGTRIVRRLRDVPESLAGDLLYG
eukprot:scaffold3918_cov66-Phaeocystis_antarctica.AAC.1